MGPAAKSGLRDQAKWFPYKLGTQAWEPPREETVGEFEPIRAIEVFHKYLEVAHAWKEVEHPKPGIFLPMDQASVTVLLGPAVNQSFLDHVSQLEAEFNEHARKWEADTRFMSSIVAMSIHPSYQRIIGMGKPAIPFILHELQERPNHWFWALNAIAGEDPASSEKDFDTAIQAWIEWGKKRGYIK